MCKDVKKTSVFTHYTEAFKIHTRPPKVHWEDNTSLIYVVEYKIVTHRVKKNDIKVCFIQDFLSMVYLFQNMRSIVSCHQICAPKHVQVPSSVGVLNIRLASDSTHTVILNTIN